MKKILFFMIFLLGYGISHGQPTTTVKTTQTKPSLVSLKSDILTLQKQYDQQIKSAEETAEKLKVKLNEAMKDLQSQDKLGNTEIQHLMSNYNEAQTTLSSIQKKRDDAINAVISKI